MSESTPADDDVVDKVDVAVGDFVMSTWGQEHNGEWMACDIDDAVDPRRWA